MESQAGHKQPVVWGDRGRTPTDPAICSGVFGALYTSISRNDDGDAGDVINRTARRLRSTEVLHRGSAVNPSYRRLLDPDLLWASSYLTEPNFNSFSASLNRAADLWLNSISLILAHQSRWLLRSNLLSHRLFLLGWSSITRLHQMGCSCPVHTWWEDTSQEIQLDEDGVTGAQRKQEIRHL